MDLGDVLAGLIAEDPPHVLGDPLAGGDGEGEEQRVELRAVEALADVAVGRDEQELAVLGEPFVDRTTLRGRAPSRPAPRPPEQTSPVPLTSRSTSGVDGVEQAARNHRRPSSSGVYGARLSQISDAR